MQSKNIADLCAEDIMQHSVVKISASESLAAAERILIESQISGGPVVDATGKVLGVLSLRDLTRHNAEDRDLPDDADLAVFDDIATETEQVAFARPTTGACAADVMSQDVVSVPPTTPVTKVARIMRESKVHRVLVTVEGKLVGIVSSMDLIGVLAGAE